MRADVNDMGITFYGAIAPGGEVLLDTERIELVIEQWGHSVKEWSGNNDDLTMKCEFHETLEFDDSELDHFIQDIEHELR